MEKDNKYNKLVDINLKPVSLKKQKSQNSEYERLLSPGLKKMKDLSSLKNSPQISFEALPSVSSPKRIKIKASRKKLGHFRSYSHADQVGDMLLQRKEREQEILHSIMSNDLDGAESEISKSRSTRIFKSPIKRRKSKKVKIIKIKKTKSRSGSFRSIRLRRDSSLDFVLKENEDNCKEETTGGLSRKKKSKFSGGIIKLTKKKKRRNTERLKNIKIRSARSSNENLSPSDELGNPLKREKSKFAISSLESLERNCDLDDIKMTKKKERKKGKKKKKRSKPEVSSLESLERDSGSNEIKVVKRKKKKKKSKKSEGKSKEGKTRIRHLMDVLKNCSTVLIFFSKYKEHIESKAAKRKESKKRLLNQLMDGDKVIIVAKNLVLDYVKKDLEEVIINSQDLDFDPRNLQHKKKRSKLYVRKYFFQLKISIFQFFK